MNQFNSTTDSETPKRWLKLRTLNRRLTKSILKLLIPHISTHTPKSLTILWGRKSQNAKISSLKIELTD